MPDDDAMKDDALAEDTGEGAFQTRIRTGGVEIIADEPVDVGGLGSGPSPYQLLAAALASCTTMTLRLYATRKGWPVRSIRTSVGHKRDPNAVPTDRFTRRIEIDADMDPAHRARLLEIADRCPVHRTLTAGAAVEVVTGNAVPAIGAATDHAADMEALIAVGRGSFDFVG